MKIKKLHMMHSMVGPLRKVLLLVINVLFNHSLVFRIVGVINQRWGFLSSVFVMYPATKDYTSAYLYQRHWHITKRLNGREIYCVDSTNGKTNDASWPFHLKGRRAILINISRSHALGFYTDLFWQGLVLINEVYPEPSADELKTITEKGCSAYHVVGIRGKAYPSFPNAYTGGIPCCAARISEDMKIIVKRLS